MTALYLQCRVCAKVITAEEMASFRVPSLYRCCDETSLAPMQSAPRYECLKCGAVSYNARDAAERYCARCHEFADP